MFRMLRNCNDAENGIVCTTFAGITIITGTAVEVLGGGKHFVVFYWEHFQ